MKNIRIGYIGSEHVLDVEFKGLIDFSPLNGKEYFDAYTRNEKIRNDAIAKYPLTKFMSIPEFVTAFNNEEISDCGFICYVEEQL